MCQQKTCAKCAKEAPVSDFYVTRGLPTAKCKSCIKTESTEARKSALAKDPEKVRQYSKRYYHKNKIKVAERTGAYRAENPELYKEAQAKYRNANRAEVRAKDVAHKTQRLKTDPLYRAVQSLRNRIRAAIKTNAKASKTLDLVGCSIQDLRAHLEARFQFGMSWSNYGKDGWHIDHIYPCASFDLADPEQQCKCFNYKNLQPLWAADNIQKGDKLPLILSHIEGL